MPEKRTVQFLALLIVIIASPVVADDPVDLKVLESRALQGDGNAQYYLAESFYSGKRRPQSYPEALKWYLLAAEKGHMMAQYLVGVMHANAEGIPLNYPEGYAWMSLVAAQGDGDAKRLMGMYLKEMSASQIVEAKQRADILMKQLLR